MNFPAEKIIESCERILSLIKEYQIELIKKEKQFAEKKKLQIICPGVPEAPSNVTKDKQREHDIVLIKSIFHSLRCIVNDSDIKFVRRIGVKSSTNTRAICVGFMNEDTKSQVLHYAFRLRNSKWRNVKIQQDLTYEEREEFRALLKVKREMNLTRENLLQGEIWSVVGARGQTRLAKVKMKKKL